MRLNPMQMERLAGAEEFAAGKELEEAGSVRVSEQDSTMVRYTVAGKPPRTVTLGRSLVLHCDCELFTQRGCCRHAVAAWLAAERAGIPESMLKKNAPRNAAGLTDLIMRQMPTGAGGPDRDPRGGGQAVCRTGHPGFPECHRHRRDAGFRQGIHVPAGMDALFPG